jgi:hypothetical protein
MKRVTDGVKDAAVAVAHAADDHVVQPVGKALGLISPDKPRTRSSIKAARKLMAKPLGPKQEAKRKAKVANTLTGRPESAKSKLYTPTNSGRVPNVRRGASKGR